MAWLDAVPENKDKKPSKTISRKTRRQTLQAKESANLKLPPLEGFAYLLEYFFEVGPGMNHGGNYGALDFREIDAWQRTTHLELSAWEVLTIKKLSDAYMSKYRQAEDPNCPAPYMQKATAEQTKKIESALDTAFDSLNRSKQGR